jgi:hypothetical protein
VSIKVEASESKSDKSSGGSKSDSKQGSFNVDRLLMQTIVDPNLVHKLVSLFMNYYIISDCFRAKTQASLNFILKRSIGIEVILNCLRLSPNEMKVIEAIFMTLLFETVEYSRLKQQMD